MDQFVIPKDVALAIHNVHLVVLKVVIKAVNHLVKAAINVLLVKCLARGPAAAKVDATFAIHQHANKVHNATNVARIIVLKSSTFQVQVHPLQPTPAHQ